MFLHSPWPHSFPYVFNPRSRHGERGRHLQNTYGSKAHFLSEGKYLRKYRNFTKSNHQTNHLKGQLNTPRRSHTLLFPARHSVFDKSSRQTWPSFLRQVATDTVGNPTCILQSNPIRDQRTIYLCSLHTEKKVKKGIHRNVQHQTSTVCDGRGSQTVEFTKITVITSLQKLVMLNSIKAVQMQGIRTCSCKAEKSKTQ